MGKSRFAELMAKSLDGSATEEELKELELFLAQYPHYKKTQQVTYAISQKADEPPLDIDKEIDAIWTRINNYDDRDNAVVKQVGSIKYFKWIGAAAAMLTVAVAAYMLYVNYVKNQQNQLAVIQQIDVPYGKTKQITLADGTRVKLNAGSHFSYPIKFQGAKREVQLDGEGFFEVAKNAHKPFYVHTGGITVKVLGTVFNLKAYRNDDKIETTLLEGKVQVELTADPEKKIVLTPNEKLTINKPFAKPAQGDRKSEPQIKYEVAALAAPVDNVYPENAWIENKIIFANTTLADAALAMERKYNVRIVFEDVTLRNEQISGVLENENLETALHILKDIVPINAKIEQGTVYLARKQ
ncbi:FecR domain-containing protein [Mucilaginibacter sp. UR6-1]|uniref:FecR family protein n=1 Tax=Mucilaginibacter sp. UR6-1 TaxID=1435643 RepID=UPI001E5B070B|nr:FecR domain-containing protein [Mucilaginibacter sp. UR6-1]MCC8408212.1 FecR domain-containing protein [Mucilaginibacter sp. UR6-1]